MKYLILVLICLQLSEGIVRLVLWKGKSIHELMEKNDVLEDFLRNNKKAYPVAKYCFNKDAVAYEPITNYLDVQNIVVCNQEFGLSENDPLRPFYYSDFDKILGMAYPAMAVGSFPTEMQGMLQQGQLPEHGFSFYFSSQPTQQYGRELIFGGMDPQLYSGQITWTPMTQEVYWQIGIEEFAMGNQVAVWCSQGCQAIVDTRTFLLAVPQQYMNAFLQATGAQQVQNGDFLVNYSYIQDMPTFTFVLTGAQFPLPPSAYVLTNNGYYWFGIEATYLPSPSGQPLWILGNIFLKEYYSVYDMANNMVGFVYSA